MGRPRGGRRAASAAASFRLATAASRLCLLPADAGLLAVRWGHGCRGCGLAFSDGSARWKSSSVEKMVSCEVLTTARSPISLSAPKALRATDFGDSCAASLLPSDMFLWVGGCAEGGEGGWPMMGRRPGDSKANRECRR